MLIYGVLVYSKGKKGVEQGDVVILIFFLLFIITSIIFLDFATFIYRELLKEFKKQKDLIGSIKSLFKKQIHPILVSIILFIMASLIFYYSGRVILNLFKLLNLLIK